MTTLSYSNVKTPMDDSYAMPLVTFNSTTKQFDINEEAVTMLKGLDSPIGVISVAGMYRTGKSYLLNRMLLNRSSGFSVGPSINPCTKGLWIWNKPVSGYSPDGTPINVLIIDTEGIGATDEDHNHDNKIFTLGILLSSYFLYNSLGTIDENSIQNLSFIVNITKNIQLDNSKKEDVDIKEYAKYLPSFMWVVRDFSLQLIDVEGEPITSKQYLEKSLELQKGNSEQVEAKNKIRNLLKEFFRERDCVTLVRPLTDEDNLQNLEKMDTSKLRHEFLEQVNQVRKKVMHKVRPKSMNGQVLNGEMFLNLMKSYVTAINNGAVPVIENAWGYLCKNECQKAMNSAISHYVKQLDETVAVSFPICEEELRSAHKLSKTSALELYSKVAINGAYYEEFKKELISQIKERNLNYVITNGKQTKRECEAFLNLNFNDIRERAKRGVYKSIADFKYDIDNFITNYIDNAPAGPQREIFLYKFILKEIIIQSELFLEKNDIEMELLSSQSEEQIKKLNENLTKTKHELEILIKELTLKNENLHKLEKEKNNLILESHSSTEALGALIKDKENCIDRLNEKIEKVTKDSEKQIKQVKNEMEEKEGLLMERENKAIALQTDLEKQKLLLEQKIKLLEKSIKETSEQHALEMKSSKRDGTTITRENIDRYEQQIKQLNAKIAVIQDENIDLQTKLLEREKRMENEKTKTEEMINEYNHKIKDLEHAYKYLEHEIKENEEKFEIEKENIIAGERIKLEEMIRVHEGNENKSKESENKALQNLRDVKRDSDTLKQTLEFAESEIKQLKTQIADDKKSHEYYVKVIETKLSNFMIDYENATKANTELKAAFASDMMMLTSRKDADIELLKNENDQLAGEIVTVVKEKNNLVADFTLLNEEKEAKLNEALSKIKEHSNKIDELILQNEEFDRKSKVSIDELMNNYNLKIQTILSQCREEMEENNNRNEKIINDIRKHYEIEKQSLELKMKEERDKIKGQIAEIELEHETKINQMVKLKQEKIEELESTVQDLELTHENYVNSTEQEIVVKDRDINSLHSQLEDLSEKYNSIQVFHQQQLDKNFERSNAEKKQLDDKFDSLSAENTKHQKEISILLTKKESLEKTIEDLNKRLSELKDEYDQETKEMAAKIKTLTERLEALNMEYMMAKSDYVKEVALKNQEIDFLNMRIAELLKQLQEMEAKTEEKINSNYIMISTEMNKKISMLTKEKDDLDAKLNQKRKEMKEMEINFTRDKTMLDKEKSVLLEKLSGVTKEKNEMLENFEKEKENFSTKLQNVKNEKKRDNEMTLKENEFLKSKLKKLEVDYTELSSSYEKDRDLWKSKFDYLEEQKNTARSDLAEFQKKYELNLEGLQNKTLSEKDKFTQIQNDVVKSVEARFKTDMDKMTKAHNDKLDELNKQNRAMLNENKSLNDRLLSYERNSNDNRNGFERKLTIAVESETRLKKEIREVIEEKDKKIADLSTRYETDRYEWGNKIIELEAKLRENEVKRNYYAVDLVKLKAANDKDKDNMESEIQKLKEKILFHERSFTKLLNEHKLIIRENEQIKKNRTPSTSSNSSNIYLPKYNRFLTGNKENRNRSNGSMERVYDTLDQLPVSKIKFSSKDSQKSEEESNSNSMIA